MKSFRPILFLLAVFNCISKGYSDQVDEAYGCSISSNPTNKGLNAAFYNYTQGDKTNELDADFMAEGYKKGTIQAKASGISKPNFFFQDKGASKVENIYGEEIISTHFLVELTGYFKPPSDGFYTIQLGAVDDSAMVFFGSEGAFLCCDSSSSSSNASSDYNLFNSYLGSDLDKPKSSVYFQKDYYYPMRVIYANQDSYAIFELDVISPDGTNLSDYSQNFYQFADDEDSGSCSTTTIHEPTTSITKPWTNTYTTTFTTTGSNGEVTVEVETPNHTTTTTKPWTGSEPTTTTLTGSNGDVTVEVETPYHTSTTTKPWTGSGTTTTFITGTDGEVTEEIETPSSSPYHTPTSIVPGPFDSTFVSTGPTGPIIIIESKTPSHSTPTITTGWTGSSTVTTLVPNPTGPGSIYEVLTPTSIITTTTPWTGTTTAITTFTSNGIEYVEYKTPYGRISTGWTGLSTVTSLVSNPTGPGSIYEVFTPASKITTNVPWSGSTTETTTFTSNGIEYVEHKTPYGTISSGWTGSSTVTSLVSNPTGPGSIYEVFTPSQGASSTTVTVIKPCTGQQTTTYTTTAGCTVAVVVENPKVTATTTITDCNCTDDENKTAAGDTLLTDVAKSTTALASTAGTTTPVPGAIFQGGANKLAGWSLTLISSIMFVFMI